MMGYFGAVVCCLRSWRCRRGQIHRGIRAAHRYGPDRIGSKGVELIAVVVAIVAAAVDKERLLG